MTEPAWQSDHIDLIASPDTVGDLSIRGCKLQKLPVIRDQRGALLIAEFESHLPFVPRRHFCLFDLVDGETRGRHAHKECLQYLMVLSGAATIGIDDGANRMAVRLDQVGFGLLTGPLVWNTIFNIDAGTVLSVYASHPYDEADYLRDYGDFKTLVAQSG